MVVVYTDDIFGHSKTKQEHLQNLENVLICLVEHGFRLKKEKCFFFLRICRISSTQD